MEDDDSFKPLDTPDPLLSRLLEPPEDSALFPSASAAKRSREESQTSPPSFDDSAATTISSSGPASPSTPDDQIQSAHSDEFLSFAHNLEYTLTFHQVNRELWSTQPEMRIPYQPLPLSPLPGMPTIPTNLVIPFSQIMDRDCLVDTVDGLLHTYGYAGLSSRHVEKVHVDYTHRNGKRQHHALDLRNLHLLIVPWAKEVWLDHLDSVAGNCLCDGCVYRRASLKDARSEGDWEEEVSLGHGLEVKIILPQDSDARRHEDRGRRDAEKVEQWAGKDKLPFRRGRSTKRVRF